MFKSRQIKRETGGNTMRYAIKPLDWPAAKVQTANGSVRLSNSYLNDMSYQQYGKWTNCRAKEKFHSVVKFGICVSFFYASTLFLALI